MDNMNVLMSPYFEGNQYLQLLESELENREINVFRETHAHPLWPLFFDVVRYDIDVLHLHWTHPYFILGDHSEFQGFPFSSLLSGLFAIFFLFQVTICSVFCSRIVWTVHNRANHERKIEVLDKWVSRRLLSVTDTVQVWDRRTAEELEQYLGCEIKNMIIVPHGNYVPLYPLDKHSKAKARSKLSLDPKKRTFLYFGRIREYKQIPQLLTTWQKLNPSNGQLLVAGNSKNSQLTEQIKSLAEDSDDIVLNLRYIPDEEVPLYFEACDLTVFPYDRIFNSGSVLLAMTFGKPFIAPDKGSIGSVDPGGNILYNTTNGGLYNALSRALDLNLEELERTGTQNRIAAEKEYDWESIVDNLVREYQL